MDRETFVARKDKTKAKLKIVSPMELKAVQFISRDSPANNSGL